MLKKLSITTFILAIFVALLTNVSSAYAAGEHRFSLSAIDWDPIHETGTTNPINSGDDVEPGQVIQVAIEVAVGTPTVLSMQLGLNYDNTMVEPVYDEDNNLVMDMIGTTYQGGVYPAKGTTGTAKNATNWTVLSNVYNNSQVLLIIKDTARTKQLVTDGTLLYLYFRVKDTAPAGGVINFTWDNTYNTMESGPKPIASGISFNVFGTMSSDNTLASLTVKNGGTTYALTPEFVAGSATPNVFSTVVPNSIATVVISALPHDATYGVVLPGGLGNKGLNVGDNSFQIIGQAQNGTMQIYTVNIKRLSNNADLSALSMTSGTLNPSFSGTTTTYTATVPYATANTTVSATVTDTGKATIASGTGLWNLTNSGGTINTKNIVVNAENCASIYLAVPGNSCTSKTYTLNVTRTAPSNNSNLSALTVDGTTVPSFNSATLTYTLPNQPNNKASVVIAAMVADTGKATITSGTGTKPLNVGDNSFPVVVTAEDGTTKTYTIHIRRLSNDCNSSTMSVVSTPTGTLNPTFSPTFYNYYTYNIGPTVTDVTITGNLSSSSATKTSGYTTHAITGTTTINVINTAEDGTICTYVINVTKALSSNNNLSSLSIDGQAIAPEFNTATTLYTLTVPNNITSINVSAAVEDMGKAIITSGTGTKMLNVGTNTVQVRVTAENGTTKDYTITVTREKSTNANLSTITINGTPITGFDKDVLIYNLVNAPYSTTNITIAATKEDNTATIPVANLGVKALNTGVNTFNIVVTAEDGVTIKTYTLNITRDKNNIATLSSLSVPGATLSPTFASNTTVYNITLPNTKTIFNPADVIVTATDLNATVLKDNALNLSTTGVNTFNIVVTAEDGVTTKTYTLNITRLQSDNANLNTLTVTNGSFNPSFVGTTYSYTVTVPVDTTNFDVAATVADSKATITSGAGNYTITGATTSVSVVVTAEDGTTKTYNLTVNRAQSSNNNLSSLTLTPGGVNEAFSPTKTLYTATVAGNITSIDVSAVVEDAGRATIVSGTGNHSLNVGINTIQVRVRAENGTTKDYTITVTRSAKTVANLSSLSVDGVLVAGFAPDILSYTLSNVANDKTSVNITYTKEDVDATVSGYGVKTLSTGGNTFNIVVTAQDGITKKTYTINIYRGKSTNTNLSDIKVDGLSITGFDKAIKSYNLSVPNEITTLNLVAIKEDPAANVFIVGNNNFNTTGVNTISIIVTSENGEIDTYYLNVTRAKSDNNYLSNIALSSGLLDPVFEKTKLDYNVVLTRSVTSITFTPTLEDSKASYTIIGNANLSVGENIYRIVVTSESGIERTYSITVNRQYSNNNYLTDLTIDGITISGFNKNNVLYTINVPSTTSTINIGGTKEDPIATVNGFKSYTLVTGTNTIPIVVTAENAEIRTYSIVVNRAQSSNSYLNSLSILQTVLNESFQFDSYNYTAAVAYSVTNIDIQAEVQDLGKATVAGTGNKTLNTGINTFNIVVTAEDNTTRTYTLVVDRAKNSNANLNNIVISGGFDLTPVFDKNTTTYSLLVPHLTSSLNITPYKEDLNSTVTGGGLKTLTTGMNTFTIAVTAENGVTKKNYILNITREYSSNAYIRSISSTNGTISPAFDKETYSYQMSVPFEVASLDLNVVKDDSAATLIVTGKDNLIVGVNTVNILVTAENGDTTLYTIEVTREPSANNFLSSLSVKDMVNTEYLTNFSKVNLSYTVTVSNDIDSVIIDATLDDSNAMIISGMGTKQLNIGSNNFSIVVKSANNVPRTYTINVVRQASGNAYLSNLYITGYNLNPVFNKDTILYTVDVPSTVTSVEINGLTEALASTALGFGTFNIVTGVNTFQVKVTAENGEVTKTYSIVVNKAASANNNLANLTVNPGAIAPVFNKNTLFYTMTVENSIGLISIGATQEDSSATVTGTGNKVVAVGRNVFDIVVTAENNITKTYQIEVNRTASANNNLLDLTVDGSTVINFDKDTRKYTLNVENSKAKVDISATTEDITATVAGIGQVSLNTGLNTFQVTVTAQNGDVKIYEIDITRAKSSNNYLTSIGALEGAITPEFNKDVSHYNITVLNEVTSLNLSTPKEVSTSMVEIEGNSSFNVGLNTVYISVIAENGEIRTYTLTVNRQPYANNFLTAITVSGAVGGNYELTPTFVKSTLGYTVFVDGSETDITINATKETLASTLIGTGLHTISGSNQTLELKCTSTSGVERIYTITVRKVPSVVNTLSNLTVSEGTLDPSFDSTTTAYIVDVDSATTQIQINATATNANATVVGTGIKTLNFGKNTFNVIVTAENGSIRNYTIFVMRNRSSNNSLSSLTVSNGVLSPAFSSTITNYVVDVASEIDSIDIAAVSEDSRATITGTGTKPLNNGSNTFNVTVTSEDNSHKTYTIIVNRGLSTNVYLSNLSVTGYLLNETFDKDTTAYTLNISDPSVNSITVSAIPIDSGATVTITGNTELVVGGNTITITVSNNGHEKIYTISVNKGNNKITSIIHTVGDTYIETIVLNKSAADVISEMTNPSQYLKIYDAEDNLYTGDKVATGMVIKLIVDGTVLDSKILIVKGDITGDGLINVSDILAMRTEILSPNLTGAKKIASDTTNDNITNVADLLKLRAHVLGSASMY